MTHETRLFVLDHQTSDSEISEMAEHAREISAHLVCMLMGQAPTLPMNAYGAMPYGGMSIPDDWPKALDEAKQKMRGRTDELQEILGRCNASGEVVPVLCADVDINSHVARRALACDVALVARNLRDSPALFREVTHGILFGSPLPLILNLDPTRDVSRVFIAWDAGKRASRAVHAAYSFLGAGQDVTVACFDADASAGGEPGADVAAWLGHRGCKVTLSQYPTGGTETGRCILARAAEVGADLVVMGAYGHSRMREAVFGGSTRTMLEQETMPVLLTH